MDTRPGVRLPVAWAGLDVQLATARLLNKVKRTRAGLESMVHKKVPDTLRQIDTINVKRRKNRKKKRENRRVSEREREGKRKRRAFSFSVLIEPVYRRPGDKRKGKESRAWLGRKWKDKHCHLAKPHHWLPFARPGGLDGVFLGKKPTHETVGLDDNKTTADARPRLVIFPRTRTLWLD